MSSRKELVDALQRLLRSPTNATIKDIQMGRELGKLAIAKPRPAPAAAPVTDAGNLEDEEEANMQSLMAPPPPKEKPKPKPKADKPEKRKNGSAGREEGSKRRKFNKFVEFKQRKRGRKEKT